MEQREREPVDALEQARMAAAQRDYRRAEALAVAAMPDDLQSLAQFRQYMEMCEQAVESGDWRTALRALADARIALAGTRCLVLEGVIHERLQQVIREGGRP